jgi:hypothetical protein
VTGTIRALLAAALACLATLLGPSAALGHDVPVDVTMVAFIKPAGDRVTMVVRLPAAAIASSSILFGGIVVPTGADGSIDMTRAKAPLLDAAGIVADLLPVYEGDRRLPLLTVRGVRLSPPDDRSFAAYDLALARATGAGPATDAGLGPGQGFFDAALEYRVDSDRSEFSLEPNVTALAQRVLVALRFLPAGSDGVRAYEVSGDSGRFRLDPRWYYAAFTFVAMGFVHVLEGADHLLFLICLVIPLRRWQSLVPVVTAFTVAHSITLVASTSALAPGGAWFAPVIETLIAASIVYMAVENIWIAQPRRRWITTFMFGLAHGFGFSFALRDSLQFAGSHLYTSLFSFNVGVELAQICVLVIAAPALSWLFRRVVPERLAAIALSAIVAHVGWHWLTERGGAVLPLVPWPSSMTAAVPWLAALLVIASLLRVTTPGYRRRYIGGGQPEVQVSPT